MGDSHGPLACRIWVGGLPTYVTEEEIRTYFDQIGDVMGVRIRSSARDTFGFVTFGRPEDVDEAIMRLDNTSFLGHRIRVAPATKDPQKEPGSNPPREGDYMDRARENHHSGCRDDDREFRRLDDRQSLRHADDRENRQYNYRTNSGSPRRPMWPAVRAERGRQYGCDANSAYDHNRSRGNRRDEGRPRSRRRSRTPHRDGVVRYAGKVPVGRHKITIANIPEDMTWLELKDLGREYGQSLTFVRTYRHNNNFYGMLEFKDRCDAETAIRELDNRRVQGCLGRLHAYYGSGPGG